MDDYLTNDLVTLSSHRMQINGLTLSLNSRAFVVVLLLCKAASASAGLPPRSGFRTNRQILEGIARIRVTEPALVEGWDFPVAEDIRSVIHDLRNKIKAGKGNPNLFESGKRGEGYRLSTPARNIEIVP